MNKESNGDLMIVQAMFDRLFDAVNNVGNVLTDLHDYCNHNTQCYKCPMRTVGCTENNEKVPAFICDMKENLDVFRQAAVRGSSQFNYPVSSVDKLTDKSKYRYRGDEMVDESCEEYRQETILTKLMYDKVEYLLDELIEKLDKPFPFCEKIKGYDCAEHCPMGDMGCFREEGKPRLISRLQAHLKYIRNGTIDQNKEVIRWIETFQKEIPQLDDFDNDGGETNWITLTPKK